MFKLNTTMNTQHVPENPQMPEIPEAVIKKQKELK